MAKRKTPSTFKIKEEIDLEQFAWLLVGMTFGWLAGKLGGFLFVAVPIAVFVVWTVGYFHRRSLA